MICPPRHRHREVLPGVQLQRVRRRELATVELPRKTVKFRSLLVPTRVRNTSSL